MADQKIIIPLNEKSYGILIEIIGKYRLQENDDEALVKAKEGKLLNENIAIRLTRDLMLEKISNTQFLDAIHENFKTEAETTKKIALDIVNTLIPVLEKVPEDKLKEYNSRNNPESKSSEEISGEKTSTPLNSEEEKKEAFRKAKEALMKKIGARTVEQKSPVSTQESGVAKEEIKTTSQPSEKKLEVKNVEQNAKKLVQERVTPPAPAPQKDLDPYKESIE